MDTSVIPFEARGVPGTVRVTYGVNDDPRRWGFDLLGLASGPEIARGFPVIEARVEYPAEGYRAYFGWIQLVRYQEVGSEEPTVLVDVAPQLKETGVPYFAWGLRPTLFDATAFGTDVTWRALAFLTFTPDGLMTRVVEPACGFGWGYDLRSRRPAPAPLRAATREDWPDVRDAYASRYPEWTFGGEAWEP